MKGNLLIAVFLLALVPCVAQNNYYFPPLTGNTWDTTSPAVLSWCTDKMDSVIDFVGQKNEGRYRSEEACKE